MLKNRDKYFNLIVFLPNRTATARGKAEQADISAVHARDDSDVARVFAKQFAPDFHQPGMLYSCTSCNIKSRWCSVQYRGD